MTTDDPNTSQGPGPTPATPPVPPEQKRDEQGSDREREQARSEQRQALGRQERARTPPMPQQPSVGRVVHFVDREMALHTANRNEQKKLRGEEPNVKIEPFAAMITRVHYDADGVPTGTVGLNVFDPELGSQIKRDVPFSLTYDAGHWSWPLYVPGR